MAAHDFTTPHCHRRFARDLDIVWRIPAKGHEISSLAPLDRTHLVVHAGACAVISPSVDCSTTSATLPSSTITAAMSRGEEPVPSITRRALTMVDMRSPLVASVSRAVYFKSVWERDV